MTISERELDILEGLAAGALMHSEETAWLNGNEHLQIPFPSEVLELVDEVRRGRKIKALFRKIIKIAPDDALSFRPVTGEIGHFGSTPLLPDEGELLLSVLAESEDETQEDRDRIANEIDRQRYAAALEQGDTT